jgi:hypothetical protein
MEVSLIGLDEAHYTMANRSLGLQNEVNANALQASAGGRVPISIMNKLIYMLNHTQSRHIDTKSVETLLSSERYSMPNTNALTGS